MSEQRTRLFLFRTLSILIQTVQHLTPHFPRRHTQIQEALSALVPHFQAPATKK